MRCPECDEFMQFDLAARLRRDADVAWVCACGGRGQERAGLDGIGNAKYKEFLRQKVARRNTRKRKAIAS